MLKLTGPATTILNEGMGGRMKRKNGQLVPLRKRTNTQQQKQRNVRIAARRTVADAIIRSQNIMAAAMNHYFKRGFFGRLKWLATGR